MEALLGALKQCWAIEQKLVDALKRSNHVVNKCNDVTPHVRPGPIQLVNSRVGPQIHSQKPITCTYCMALGHELLQCRKLKFAQSQLRKSEKLCLKK